MAGVLLKNLTRSRTPRLPFRAVVADVLPRWDISLVFVGEKRARDLNMSLRKKKYVPNVLSYEVSEKSASRRTGEIIICLSETKKQAPDFLLPAPAFCLFLFIHALLHIKGLAHGATMEKCERDLLARYVTAHSDRH